LPLFACSSSVDYGLSFLLLDASVVNAGLAVLFLVCLQATPPLRYSPSVVPCSSLKVPRVLDYERHPTHVAAVVFFLFTSWSRPLSPISSFETQAKSFSRQHFFLSWSAQPEPPVIPSFNGRLALKYFQDEGGLLLAPLLLSLAVRLLFPFSAILGEELIFSSPLSPFRCT